VQPTCSAQRLVRWAWFTFQDQLFLGAFLSELSVSSRTGYQQQEWDREHSFLTKLDSPWKDTLVRKAHMAVCHVLQEVFWAAKPPHSPGSKRSSVV